MKKSLKGLAAFLTVWFVGAAICDLYIGMEILHFTVAAMFGAFSSMADATARTL